MRVFVVRPFGTKTDRLGKSIDFDRMERELIAPALAQLGWTGSTTAEITDSGNIRDDMFRLLVEADVVIADITIHNANVFYELGIRHALRKRRTFLLRGGPVADDDIFDLKTDRYLWYPVDAPDQMLPALLQSLRATAVSERSTDSPVFQLVPELDEADFVRLQVVPRGLRDEVARAAGSQGWLRLLADDVRGLRFELGALRLIGNAQWQLRDLEGALDSWNRVLARYPADVEANLAVANLRERQGRTQPQHLVQSDLAIDRVLDRPELPAAVKAEALALRGRNLKTRWKAELDRLQTPRDKRRHGCSRDLRESFEAYLQAFRCDLNAFYPGLNALQLATILLALAKTPGSGWEECFDDRRDALRYKQDLAEQVVQLQGAVSLALDAQTGDDPWLAISRADLLFLTQTHEGRVIARYQDAVRTPFQREAVRGQLAVFEELGVRDELARKVLGALPEASAAAERPVHLVVFAGHQPDDAGREPPRFPPSALASAEARIRAALEELVDPEAELVALGSAARGADLLFHRCCKQLGLRTHLCLPMPLESFVVRTFAGADADKAELLELCRECEGPAPRIKQLVLSDHETGLPTWLAGTERNPWERGNRWALRMAESWGADRVTLLALWDGQPAPSKGGTAYFVELARRSAHVVVKVLSPLGDPAA